MRYQASAQNLPIAFVPKRAVTDVEPVSALFDERAHAHHVLPGEVVFLDGECADHVYQIVSGTVRCCTIAENGRRQIFRFAGARDFIGLADLDTWHFTVEAVDHVILRTIPRAWFESAIIKDPKVLHAVRKFLVTELATREQQLISMAYLSSDDRLLQFLEDYAEGRSKRGFIVLPMTRQDIGDHLGLTLETVSRAISNLRKTGVIEMKGFDRFRFADQTGALAA